MNRFDPPSGLSPSEFKTDEIHAIEELVPIRLEVEYDHYRFRDTFVWNLNGENI